MKTISQAWSFDVKEGDPSMIMYFYDSKEWRIMGETLHTLTGIIKPSKKGAIYAYKFYMANK